MSESEISDEDNCDIDRSAVRDTLPFNAEIISIGASSYSDTASACISGWSAAVDLYGSG
jgi:hypothetical protein